MSLGRGLFSAASGPVRKTLSVLFFAVLLLAIVIPVLTPALAYEPGSGILEASHSKDIFLNIDAEMLDELRIQTGNPNLSIEDIAADLKAQLIALDPETYNEVNIRIQYNETQINTTDLSTWYVYDHYYSGGGYGDFRPYAANDPAVFNEMRPYYPTTTETVAWPSSASKASQYYTDHGISPPWSEPPSSLATGSAQALTGVFTIKQLLEYGTAAGMVLPGSLAGNYIDKDGGFTTAKYPNARRLKEHIYSGADENGAFMYLMGYGSSSVTATGNCKTDFLFYPAQESGRKKIEFQINSADVRTHSMNGAGFLLNTSIVKVDDNPANDEIRGYVLYLTFTLAGSDSAPTGAEVYLYRINDKTKVDNFHTRKEQKSAVTNVYATNYMTKVATASNSAAVFGSGAGFKSVLDFTVEFDDTGFYLRATDPGTGITTPVKFGAITDAEGFTSVNMATGAYGFGPLVDFGYNGHSCSTVSAFKFSNLRMSMETDVFKALRESHYYNAQNVDRYFVNLSAEAIDPESAPDFWDGIARLRTDKIFYISNQDDGVIDTEDADGANGLNGKTLAESNYTKMIAELAEYIDSAGTADWNDEDLPEMKIAVPVAISSVIGWDDLILESGETDKPLFRIERAMTDSNPVTVALHDRSTISTFEDPEAKVTHLEIYAYSPNGTVLYKETVEVNETGVYELFILDAEHDALGTYTVELTAVYMSPDGKTEISRSPSKSVNTFELIEDIYWPQVFLDDKIIISGGDTSADLLTGGRTEDGPDGAVFKISEGVYEGNDVILHLTDDHREPLHDDWGVQAYLIYDPLFPGKYGEHEIVLPDLWPDYLIELNDLGSGLRDIIVTVWDWVGHETEYTITVNPRVNTLTAVIGGAPDFVGGEDDLWNETAEKLRTHFSELFIINEEVDLSDVSEFPLINGYKLIGFTTDPEGTEPMASVTITEENTALYPVFKDLTPVIIIGGAGGAGATGGIGATGGTGGTGGAGGAGATGATGATGSRATGDTVIRYVTTELSFSGKGSPAYPADYRLEYSVNGGPPVTVDGLEGYTLLLTPPETGETVYLITVTDASGAAATKKIIIKSPESLMDDIAGIAPDNVTSDYKDYISDLSGFITDMLGGEGYAGVTPEERVLLEEMLDDLVVLTQRILKVKTTLNDIAEAIRAFKEGSLSPGDMPALSTLDEKAEELLSAYDGNLTEEEKDLVDGYRGEIGDMILSLSRSSPGDAGSGAQSAEQPLSEESVPPDDTQDTTADAQEAGDEQAGDQDTGITPADDNESVTGRSAEASTEENAEGDSNFHPNVAFPDDASLDDFPDMDFYSSQPGHDSPGGFHPGIPPNPNLLEYMLIPYLNEFGSVFFVEIDGLSAPLGEWSWDSGQGIWVFDEYTQPGEFDALPQTGGSNALLSALLLSGLLLAGTGIALSLRKRQPKAK